jgi:luciferase-like monooxygenase
VSLDAELSERLLALDALDQRPSRFGGKDAFFVGKREVAHFEGPGVLDLRLTRKEIQSRKDTLSADPRATLRGSSDWLELACREPADLDWVLELVQVAIAANA